ncbi:MAG TPA: methyltransferase domain-containing protein [Bacteroidetes bacterium]|nr:methyltransferase domain-containing protein [Bacteroidota bacterium]
MSVHEFFDLFLEELRHHGKLGEYYKFHADPARLAFRRAYFTQRLQYVFDRVMEARNRRQAPDGFSVWDAGSGYSTTQIFLALNGVASHGSTLEYYFDHLPQRFDYWSKYGDMGLVSVSYENIFEAPVKENSEDIIIVQDTLHHLEPLRDSLRIFYKTLRPGGFLLAVEENGNNILQRIKLYRQRGNKRIIEFYDEGLGRKVLMGNENIRSYKTWKKELEKAGFQMDEKKLHYVRFFPPSFFKNKNINDIIKKEQHLWKKYPLLKEYFFFGVDFIGVKATESQGGNHKEKQAGAGHPLSTSLNFFLKYTKLKAARQVVGYRNVFLLFDYFRPAGITIWYDTGSPADKNFMHVGLFCGKGVVEFWY